MCRELSNVDLVAENNEFAGTGGVSAGNRHLNFVPAFKDEETGRVELSRFIDGRIAPCHLLDNLPDEWVIDRDDDGRVQKIKLSIISGFFKLDRFFTRQEAADITLSC